MNKIKLLPTKVDMQNILIPNENHVSVKVQVYGFSDEFYNIGTLKALYGENGHYLSLV